LLLRGFHQASRVVPFDNTAGWPSSVADPKGGTMLCHNDVCMENVVFRDGRATALIDFDLAAPGRPIWDLAMAARYWVPMLPPEQTAITGREHLDRVARLRLLVESYGLPRHEWPDVIPVLQAADRVCRQFVAKMIAAGHEEMRRIHAELGGWQRWDRADEWVTEFSWM
jgi:aminoglycoside phosphotransferase (APT) family kinase protein